MSLTLAVCTPISFAAWLFKNRRCEISMKLLTGRQSRLFILSSGERGQFELPAELMGLYES